MEKVGFDCLEYEPDEKRMRNNRMSINLSREGKMRFRRSNSSQGQIVYEEDEKEIDFKSSNGSESYLNETSNDLVGIESSVGTIRTLGDKSKSSSKYINNGRWTHDEHNKFLEALKLYGKDWIKVQRHIGSRTSAQTRSHAQKFFSKLQRRKKFKELAFFDALLSRKGKYGNELDSEDKEMCESLNLPFDKTKAIFKNYGTRFIKVLKQKENEKDIFIVQPGRRKASSFQQSKGGDDSIKASILFEVLKPSTQQSSDQTSQQTQQQDSQHNKITQQPQKIFQVIKLPEMKSRSNSEPVQISSSPVEDNILSQDNQQGYQQKTNLVNLEQIDEEDFMEYLQWKKLRKQIQDHQSCELKQDNNINSNITSSFNIPSRSLIKSTTTPIHQDTARSQHEAEYQDQVFELTSNLQRCSINNEAADCTMQSVAEDKSMKSNKSIKSITQYLIESPQKKDFTLLSYRNSRQSQEFNNNNNSIAQDNRMSGLSLFGSFKGIDRASIRSGLERLDFNHNFDAPEFQAQTQVSKSNRMAVNVSEECLDDSLLKRDDDDLFLNDPRHHEKGSPGEELQGIQNQALYTNSLVKDFNSNYF